MDKIIKIFFVILIDFLIILGNEENNLQTEQEISNADSSLVSPDIIENYSYYPFDNVLDIIDVQPGFYHNPETGLHLLGGQEYEIGYFINGVSLKNPFTGSSGLQLAPSCLKDLSLTFNNMDGKYRNSGSGIISMITREGGDVIRSHVSSYIGDYYSIKNIYNVTKSVYPVEDAATGDLKGIGIYENSLKPFNPIFDLNLDISGPIKKGTSHRLYFYLNGRYHNNEGYLYGREWFNPQGQVGDSSLVPMNSAKNLILYGNICYDHNSRLRCKYSFIVNDSRRKEYVQLYKYNPHGVAQQFENAKAHILTLQHKLSNSLSYNITTALFSNEYKSYVYKDAEKKVDYLVEVTDSSSTYIIDLSTAEGEEEFERIKNEQLPYRFFINTNCTDVYIHPDAGMPPVSYSFYNAGMDHLHIYHNSDYWTSNANVKQQLTGSSFIKYGIIYNQYQLKLDEFMIITEVDEVTGQPSIPFQPAIP